VATPERVVIAAAGVVTPIGQDLEAFVSLVTGASGIPQIERSGRRPGAAGRGCKSAASRMARRARPSRESPPDRGGRRPRRRSVVHCRPIRRKPRWWWAPASGAPRSREGVGVTVAAAGRPRRHTTGWAPAAGRGAGDHGVHRGASAPPRWRSGRSAARGRGRRGGGGGYDAPAAVLRASTPSARSRTDEVRPFDRRAGPLARRALALPRADAGARPARCWGRQRDGFHCGARARRLQPTPPGSAGARGPAGTSTW
jgi:hypothetical protein